MYYLLVTIYVLACLLLIVVILLQQGKGGDMAAAFGGGGSQAAFGARAGATLLTKMTAGLAAGFIILSMVLAIWGQQGPGSVVGGVDGPPPVTLPAEAAPAPVAPQASEPEATQVPPAGGQASPPEQP